jgi:hypothetical protein
MHVCMCTCVYVCMYVCMYVRVSACMPVNREKWASMDPTQVCAYVHNYMCTCVHTYIHTPYSGMYLITCSTCVYVCVRVCMLVNRERWGPVASMDPTQVCAYVCNYMYICVCMCVCVYVHVCMYVCVHVSKSTGRNGDLWTLLRYVHISTY